MSKVWIHGLQSVLPFYKHFTEYVRNLDQTSEFPRSKFDFVLKLRMNSQLYKISPIGLEILRTQRLEYIYKEF